MKVYTRSGDDGSTALYRGGRVSKASQRISACGAVDELNSLLGWIRSHSLPEVLDNHLHKIQHLLFVIGADLATPQQSVKPGDKILRLPAGSELFLERQIDLWQEELPALTHFILPGGTPLGAIFHWARAVCRWTEREVVALAASEPVNSAVVVFLNRLSDFLFMAGRWLNHHAGIEEELWKGDKESPIPESG